MHRFKKEKYYDDYWNKKSERKHIPLLRRKFGGRSIEYANKKNEDGSRYSSKADHNIHSNKQYKGMMMNCTIQHTT